ncbi:MAG: hypothetical protein QXV01_08625 [Candidatus Bathyarchaeia archaeon]
MDLDAPLTFYSSKSQYIIKTIAFRTSLREIDAFHAESGVAVSENIFGRLLKNNLMELKN